MFEYLALAFTIFYIGITGSYLENKITSLKEEIISLKKELLNKK